MVRHRAIPFVLLALLATALTLDAGPAPGRDRADSLRDQISGQRSRERTLQGSLARLGRLERATAREVAILERRVAAVQADLSQAETLLAGTVHRRDHERPRALRPPAGGGPPLRGPLPPRPPRARAGPAAAPPPRPVACPACDAPARALHERHAGRRDRHPARRRLRKALGDRRLHQARAGPG